jgi:ethanolamine ammonia-lyase small subunit
MSSLKKLPESVLQDSWSGLRQFTPARIALGSAGHAVPMEEVLRFRLAHAQAREAVYAVCDFNTIAEELEKMAVPFVHLHSQAQDRNSYLQRPDLGRKLDESSANTLDTLNGPACDIVLILADGLSATAINKHAVSFLKILLPLLTAYAIGPVSLVKQGRVAISDEIGFRLRAKLAIILIGERPGLSSPDSMGIYLTYEPHPGNTDESRNCISNIRTEGLSYRDGAEKLLFLIRESLRLKLSGTCLKDDSRLLS